MPCSQNTTSSAELLLLYMLCRKEDGVLRVMEIDQVRQNIDCCLVLTISVARKYIKSVFLVVQNG